MAAGNVSLQQCIAQLRPHLFSFDYVGEWFMQVEAIFEVCGITNSRTKALMVISWLGLPYLQNTSSEELGKFFQVKDKITYNDLKDKLFQLHTRKSVRSVGGQNAERLWQENMLQKFW